MTEEALTTEQELEKVRKALAAANAEAKGYREERDALAEKVQAFEAKTGEMLSKAKDDAIKVALAKEGVTDSRLIRLLDLESVELGEDGSLKGFDNTLSNAKKEWPEFFDKKRRVAGAADLSAREPVEAPKNPTELQVARLMGNLR